MCFIALVVVLIVDMITGIMAAWKKGVEPVCSYKCRQGFKKIFSYITIILLFYMTESAMQLSVGSWRIITGIFCITEIMSIMENLAIFVDDPKFNNIMKIIRGKASAKTENLADEIFNQKDRQ